MEEDLHIGHGKRDLLKVEKDHSKSYRAFQRNCQKTFFQERSILV